MTTDGQGKRGRPKRRGAIAAGLMALGCLVMFAIGGALLSAAQTGAGNTKGAADQNSDTPTSDPKASGAKPVATKTPAVKSASAEAAGKSGMTMSLFLDRLMMAESNGRNDAANARSSARGAFQFINSTFLTVVRQHFAQQVAKLSKAQILALRFNRAFARKSAEAYTRDNAAYLARRGLKPTFVNLRLAFLLGPSGAEYVLRSKATTRLATLLSPGVVRANPFMARMTVADLIARAARDLKVGAQDRGGVTVKPGAKTSPPAPRIKVRCNLGRPSCRRWLALKTRQLDRLEARKKRQAKR